MKLYLGRHVFGLAAIAFGVFTLVWHDFNIWQQIGPLGSVPHPKMLAYAVGIIEILGGLAIQSPRTARAGAIALGAVSLLFALLWVPLIIQKPQAFGRTGNFFEQFSMFAGALIVYASFDSGDSDRAAKLAKIGYYCFGVCTVSFTTVQIVYLAATADFVPKWIPLGQMFWAVATTVAFALAAIALLTGRSALLASRLLTAMIVGFGLLIWLPQPFADPHSLTSWAGNAENLGIAAAAWIVADWIAKGKRRAAA